MPAYCWDSEGGRATFYVYEDNNMDRLHCSMLVLNALVANVTKTKLFI